MYFTKRIQRFKGFNMIIPNPEFRFPSVILEHVEVLITSTAVCSIFTCPLNNVDLIIFACLHFRDFLFHDFHED